MGNDMGGCQVRQVVPRSTRSHSVRAGGPALLSGGQPLPKVRRPLPASARECQFDVRAVECIPGHHLTGMAARHGGQASRTCYTWQRNIWIGLPPDPTVRLSSRRSLAVTPLPFSSPSAPRSPGARTFTSLVLCHAWHTRNVRPAVLTNHFLPSDKFLFHRGALSLPPGFTKKLTT